MGNCAACVSQQLLHSLAKEDDTTAFRELQSCAHLYCLRPWPAEPPAHDGFSKPSDLAHAPLQPEAFSSNHQAAPPQSPTTITPTDEKPMKQAKFDQELQQNLSLAVAHEAKAAQLLKRAGREESAHHSGRQSGTQEADGRMDNLPPSLQMGALKKKVNGLVRFKVIISKKQLSEIMSSSFLSEEQPKDADLMRKMVASLLPHLPPSDHLNSVKCHHQPWRPSLDQIPEGQAT